MKSTVSNSSFKNEALFVMVQVVLKINFVVGLDHVDFKAHHKHRQIGNCQ